MIKIFGNKITSNGMYEDRAYSCLPLAELPTRALEPISFLKGAKVRVLFDVLLADKKFWTTVLGQPELYNFEPEMLEEKKSSDPVSFKSLLFSWTCCSWADDDSFEFHPECSGTNESGEHQALDFVSAGDIADLPILVNPRVNLVVPKAGNTYDTVLGEKYFSLLDVLSALTRELFFFNSPCIRDANWISLKETCDRIKSGEEKFVELDFEEIKNKIKERWERWKQGEQDAST